MSYLYISVHQRQEDGASHSQRADRTIWSKVELAARDPWKHGLQAQRDWAVGPPIWFITCSMSTMSLDLCSAWVVHNSQIRGKPVNVWTVRDERKLLTPRFNQFYSDLLGFLRIIKFYSDFGYLFSFTRIYLPRFIQDHTAAPTDCPIGLLCPHNMP